MMRKLSFTENTIVLVAANLVTGSLTFLFSIILSGEIGAQGVGLYQIVMPVYGLFICLTCGGTSTAISKVISEQRATGRTAEPYNTVTASIAFFSFWTAFISILVVLFAKPISSSALMDARAYLPILAFVPALLLVAVGSVLKGYFYGMQNTAFPAIIDISEKTVRVAVLIALVTGLKRYGLKYQVTGAVLATTAGEMTSTLLLYLFYRRSMLGVKAFSGKRDNALQLIANVLIISLPLCINGFVSTMFGTLITVMIPGRLQAAGFTPETSLSLFGKMSGMGMTIIMFPSIIIGAISTVLVPAISEESSGRNLSAVNRQIRRSLTITAAVAAAAFGIFFALPDELGILFYRRSDLGDLIFSLSFGVICSYTEATLCGILNGLGKQRALLRNTLIMSAVDIIVLYICLGSSEIGIYGYSIDFMVSPLAGCILNSMQIKKAVGVEPKFGRIIPRPLMSAFFEAASLRYIKNMLCSTVQPQPLQTVALIFLGIVIFCTAYFLSVRIASADA